jgi:predicted alpha/beta-hydrolase family hydrolase
METSARFEPLTIPVEAEISVSGVVGIPEWWPTGSRVGVVLAHDAGESLDQDFLLVAQRSLADAGFLSLRFNFPYAEAGKKRPDPNPLLERAYRAAIESLLPDPQNAPARLVVGGFGLGARIAAQLVAQDLKTDGMLLLSYPLHPAGKPAQQRADALFRVASPILFVQGTKDSTCRLDRLEQLIRRIGAPTDLRVLQDADHQFHPARGSSRSQEEIEREAVEAVNAFILKVTGSQ